MEEIEHNVPIYGYHYGKLSDLLQQMSPGDSFVTSKPYGVIRNIANKLGLKICVRSHKDGARRVWRISGEKSEIA